MYIYIYLSSSLSGLPVHIFQICMYTYMTRDFGYAPTSSCSLGLATSSFNFVGTVAALPIAEKETGCQGCANELSSVDFFGMSPI